MDPNLFHLDWERVFEALAGIVLLSFLIERALSIVFENRFLLERVWKKAHGLKEVVAFAVALIVCITWDFDAISMIILTDHTSIPGEIITAGIVAGGSKGSVKLFRDVFGFRSTAYDEYRPKAKKP